MVKVRAMRTLENALRRWGFHRIAGCDEVGRGCLAGPVVAAAVVLDPDRHIPGVCDSKMIGAAERERLYAVITRKALAWSVAAAQPDEIDAINIHRASLQAMRRAVMALAPLPDLVLVDAFRIPDIQMAQRGVVHGDRVCSAIAAASIVAKVTRDREMRAHDGADPRYGYARHKGYATADHLAALARHGYSPLHRRSFRPPSLFDRMENIDGAGTGVYLGAGEPPGETRHRDAADARDEALAESLNGELDELLDELGRDDDLLR